MVDPKLLAIIQSNKKEVNKDVCQGIVSIQGKEIINYIDLIWKTAASNFPKGLSYEGFEVCTPYEEFTEDTRAAKPFRMFELSESTVRMYKFFLKYNGEMLKPRYIKIPYILDGDFIKLNDTQYRVSPVLGGRLFNVEQGKIFMHIPTVRYEFSKNPFSFVLNDEDIHIYYLFSPSFYRGIAPENKSTLNTTLVHYLLTNSHGLTGLLKNIFKLSDFKVGYDELDLLDKNEWKVASSKQLYLRAKDINVLRIKIAIPSKEYTTIIGSVLGTLIYIMENSVENITIDSLDNPNLWIRLLYKFIFKIPDFRVEYQKMTDHLSSIKRSIDDITKHNMLLEKIPFKSDTAFFDLLVYLINNYHHIIAKHQEGDCYDLELTINKHLLTNITNTIFIVMYKLERQANTQGLNITKINSILDQFLWVKSFFNTMDHGELDTIRFPGDCKIYNSTCRVSTISKIVRSGKHNKRILSTADGGGSFNATQLEIFSKFIITKSSPSGNSVLNPFGITFDNGSYSIKRNEVIKDTIEEIRKLTKKRY